MSEKNEVDQLIAEHPELFDGMDSGDLNRETGVNVPVPDWMQEIMDENEGK